MTKEDQASYLVNLIAIMDSREDAGRTRGSVLGREYNIVYDEFVGGLQKEHEEREAKQKHNGRPEGGAKSSGDQPGLRSADRDRPADASSAGTDDSGPRRDLA